MNTVAIYTAIFGSFDWLKTHPDIPGVDFVAFTDDESLTAREDWRVITVPPSNNPRLTAKYPKIVGPQSPPLDSYEATIWIDGSMEILTPAFGEAFADLGPDDLALFRAEHGDCIHEEARRSIGWDKYDGQPIREQVEYYRSLGYPDHAGLWPCAVIGRAKSTRVDALMSDWMGEIERWSLQDQISLPFVLWQHGFTPHEWPHYPPGNDGCRHPVENPWLFLHTHSAWPMNWAGGRI
jgi:hypothetical protein